VTQRKQKTWVASNFRALAFGALVIAAAAGVGAVAMTLWDGDGGAKTVAPTPVVSSLACRPAETLMTFGAGQNDAFALTAKPDVPAAAPANGLQVRTAPLFGFDDAAVNHRFGHTFSALPSVMTAGELIVRLKPLEDGHGGGNDTLELSFTDAGGNLLPVFWRRFIGTSSANSSAGLLANHWGPTNWSAGNTFTFDLKALPEASGTQLDLIPQLNANGFVDVFLQDDSSVDFLVLNLCVRPIAATAVATNTPPVTPTLAAGTPVTVATVTAPVATPTCAAPGTAGACSPTPAATVATPTPAPVTPTAASPTPTCNVSGNATC
jgi:hypothetical protein